jgi:hypothetical protein
MTAPEWLTRRGGTLQRGHAGNAWFVIFNGQAQYRLVPVPVGGRYGCAVTQTINGKVIPSDGRAETQEQAVAAGLNALGKALGWDG